MRDVSQYLPPDDGPEPEVERILRLVIRAIPGKQSMRRQFLPREPITLIAFTSGSHTLHITSHVRGNRRVYTSIHMGTTVLRDLHTHDGHRNPGPKREEVPGPHMHFPSRKYPLVYKGNSYAYCLDDGDWIQTSEEGVQALCDELEITIDGMQGGLP